MNRDGAPLSQGPHTVFDTMHSQCYERVIHLCRRLLNSHEEAQNIAQDAFTKAFLHIDQYRNDGSPCGWVFKIAQNLCFAHVKSCGHKKVQQQETTESSTHAVVTASQQKDMETSVLDRVFVTQLMKRLWEIGQSARPPWDADDWRIFIYRYERGMSYPEIAQLLQRPEGTVKDRVRNRIQRAIELLRHEMQEIEQPDRQVL